MGKHVRKYTDFDRLKKTERNNRLFMEVIGAAILFSLVFYMLIIYLRQHIVF